jgi:hypothetical protein
MSRKLNKIPSLINGSAGVPSLEIAGKKCSCAGCDAEIVKGERCFDVPNPRTAFSNTKRFCGECFGIALDKTRADIVKLEALQREVDKQPQVTQ